MSDVEIRFEREDLSGIVAVGTYLRDAAKRFGIKFDGDCDLETKEHSCRVEITGGAGNLSPTTAIEEEYFAANGRKENERLACQTRIEKPGEVVIMTQEKKEEPAAAAEQTHEEKAEQFKKEFAELPLEKKISELVQLEAIALGDTLSYVANAPFTIADKVLDVMAQFGFKKEEAEKSAARPEEHQKASENGNNESPASSEQEKEKSADQASQ